MLANGRTALLAHEPLLPPTEDEPWSFEVTPVLLSVGVEDDEPPVDVEDDELSVGVEVEVEVVPSPVVLVVVPVVAPEVVEDVWAVDWVTPLIRVAVSATPARATPVPATVARRIRRLL